MIFVTVGTTKFPFNRLLKTVDRVLVDSGGREKLVVQSGNSTYGFKYPYTKTKKEYSFKDFINYLKKARVIITHGGPATLYLIFKFSKYYPLIIPRRKEFGEHVNDHQVCFANIFFPKTKVKILFQDEGFEGELGAYLKSPQPNKKKIFFNSPESLIKKLIVYTEQK